MAKPPSKPPSTRSSRGQIDQFLQHSKAVSEFVEKQPRLIFAIDATASRQASWDTACTLQQQMFLTTRKLASLAVQLCYYRGFHDFFASHWLTDSAELARQMSGVQCEGGHTQIGRLLKHGQSEHRKSAVRALVFIGEAFLLLAFFLFIIAKMGWKKPGWIFFVCMSLLGSLAFSVPLQLYLMSKPDKSEAGS